MGFAGFCALVLMGCGSDEAALIEAAVLEKAVGVPGADVIFQGETDQPNNSVYAYTDENGYCVLDYGEVPGVVPGDYQITVTVYRTKAGKPLPAGEEGTTLKNSGQVLQKEYRFQQKLTPGLNRLTLYLEDGQLVGQ